MIVVLMPMGMIAMSMIVVGMIVTTMVMVMIRVEQEPCADEVHDEPDHRDQDCLVEADRNRREQAGDALVADKQGHKRKNDGAGVAGEFAELSRAERETSVVRVASGEAVGER